MQNDINFFTASFKECRTERVTQDYVIKNPKKYTELTNIIKNLNNRKANNHDRASNKMIKIIHKCFPRPSIIIYQKCLDLFYFLVSWKTGKADKDHTNPSS